MKLVILGAGASFDSIYDFFDGKEIMPWRPPLANELLDTRQEFRNIIESYPGGSYYLSQLNGIFDIEDFFQKQWMFLKTNRAEDLAAHFINLNYCLSHLMFKISNEYSHVGLSNYDILIQKAYEYAIKSKEDVLFVSFNYDILLEYSFSKLYFGKRKGISIDEYIKYPIKIIKPHGSCNWFKRFKMSFKRDESQSISNNLFHSKTTPREINQNLEDEYYTLENPLTQKYFGEPNQIWNCFPQLLIPLKDKDDFILPKPHEDYLNNNIQSVNEIMIIGWKGTEAKFQHLLKQSLSSKKVEIISINAGNTDIEKTVKPFLPKANFYHYNETASKTKTDNTKVKERGPTIRNTILLDQGSFSSYTTNILKGSFVDFFKY